MSRLPSSPSDSECESEDDVFQTTYLDKLPIRAEDTYVRQETKHDSVLSKVLQSRLMVVSCKAKKKQHACVSFVQHNHYSQLFTQMAALKFENAVTQPL